MDIKEWLGEDNQLGIDIWTKKYQYNGESFEGWLDRVTDGNEDIKQLIREKKFLFGGRILANRGLEKDGNKVTFSNCYVLPQVEDSIEGIYGETCRMLARTFSYGGGVGIDISKLRPKGTKVNNTAKKTSGAVSFMDTFSQVTETIGQNGRRGALMISIDCTHPELIDFINVKTDLTKVTKANISVRVSDGFMEAVRDDKLWRLHFESEHENVEQLVKAREVFDLLCKNNWNYAEPGILFWDKISNWNLLSEDVEFKYDGVNPCAEEPLPAGGSCLLGSINLSEYVVENYFDLIAFKEDIHKIVKGMNEVLDQGLPLHPLEIQRETVRDYRQIGIGVMGIADMLIKLGVKYDTEEAIEICDKIGYTLANESIKASALLAKEEGAYPKYNKEAIMDSSFLFYNADIDTWNLVEKYGLRNSQLLTIAPTGTLSTMIGISGGIEPIFNLSYTRKTESLHGEDVYYKVYTPIAEKYIEEHELTDEEQLPEYFVTTEKLDPFMRVRMQGVWQKHIDASISSTINLPNEATVEEVGQLYMKAWEEGLKGLTIYRSGCEREGILTTDKQEEVTEVKHELKRGEWETKPKGCIEIPRKIYSGCGKELLHITIDPKEKRIIDFYITSSSTGGCKLNIQALAISMSAILRLGGSIENIKCAFRGIGKCPSYVLAKEKGKKVSKGVSCPTAILNTLMEVDKDLKNDSLEELQLLGYYDKKVEMVVEEVEEIKGLVEEIKELEEKERQEQYKKLEEEARKDILIEKQIFTKKELEYIEEYGEVMFAQQFGKCPKCGEKMEHIGGCISCMNCAFTKCE